MTSASGVLRQIEIFSDLRDDQLEWFASSAEEVVLNPGDVLLHEGDAADALFVLLEGEVRGRRETGGADAVGFIGRAGQVDRHAAILPHDAIPPQRARCDTRPASALEEGAISGNAPANPGTSSGGSLGCLADRIREYSRAEQQRDKPGSGFGKLSAGLAHELNNPASAVPWSRRAEGLREYTREFSAGLSDTRRCGAFI